MIFQRFFAEFGQEIRKGRRRRNNVLLMEKVVGQSPSSSDFRVRSVRSEGQPPSLLDFSSPRFSHIYWKNCSAILDSSFVSRSPVTRSPLLFRQKENGTPSLLEDVMSPRPLDISNSELILPEENGRGREFTLSPVFTSYVCRISFPSLRVIHVCMHYACTQ